MMKAIIISTDWRRAIGVAKAKSFSLLPDKPDKGKTACNEATNNAVMSA